MGIWDKSLIIGLGVLTLILGNFPPTDRIIAGIVLGLSLAYLLYRERIGFNRLLAVKNMLGLLPGNVLLLLGISTMEGYRVYLFWGWVFLSVSIIAFDFLVNRLGKINNIYKFLLGCIYVFIWGDISFLLFYWIRLGGKVSPDVKNYLSMGILVLGAIFITLGMYRFINLTEESLGEIDSNKVT